MKRGWYALAVIILLAALLAAGCGSRTAGTMDTGQSPATTDTTQEESAPSAESGGESSEPDATIDMELEAGGGAEGTAETTEPAEGLENGDEGGLELAPGEEGDMGDSGK